MVWGRNVSQNGINSNWDFWGRVTPINWLRLQVLRICCAHVIMSVFHGSPECSSVSFPSYSFWPNASGREGKTASRVLIWHGAHAPGGSRSEGSGPAFVRGLSEILPSHQGQGQGHPLWEDRRQRGKQHSLNSHLLWFRCVQNQQTDSAQHWHSQDRK